MTCASKMRYSWLLRSQDRTDHIMVFLCVSPLKYLILSACKSKQFFSVAVSSQDSMGLRSNTFGHVNHMWRPKQEPMSFPKGRAKFGDPMCGAKWCFKRYFVDGWSTADCGCLAGPLFRTCVVVWLLCSRWTLHSRTFLNGGHSHLPVAAQQPPFPTHCPAGCPLKPWYDM